jgi:hypothetical protein
MVDFGVGMAAGMAAGMAGMAGMAVEGKEDSPHQETSR